jgi:hypothetical protein
MAAMTREEVDQVIVALVAAYDRIAAGMYALDNHAGLAFLRRGMATGMTARVGRDVQARIEVLWAQFSAFRELLERAQHTRRERSRPGPDELTELTALLRGPAVAVDDHGLPLEPDAAAPAARLGLAELGRGLESTSSTVSQTLDRIDGACSQLASRLAALAETLTTVQSLAKALGGGYVDVDQVAAELRRSTDEVLGDPLAAVDGGASTVELEGRLSRLATDLEGARQRLAELVRLRDGYPARVDALRADIDKVAAAEAAAAQSYATVQIKIADAGLPPAPAAAAGLRDALAGLDRWRREGRWERLADTLAALERAVALARAWAGELGDAADGLMARRGELRGRLDAYHAKASRYGLVEDPALAALHRAAQDLLYTSPCDLPAATRAVFRYQQALADSTREPR